MIILSIDLSTHTGYALFDTTSNSLLFEVGHFHSDLRTPWKKGYKGEGQPYDFLNYINYYVGNLLEDIYSITTNIDMVIIEQTSKSRNRWSQKLLEWLHYKLCLEFIKKDIQIVYIDNMRWRSLLGIKLTKDQRSHNKKVSKDPNLRGKITTKHLAIWYVEELFNLSLRKKDEDIADAICVGIAYMKKEGIKHEILSNS